MQRLFELKPQQIYNKNYKVQGCKKNLTKPWIQGLKLMKRTATELRNICGQEHEKRKEDTEYRNDDGKS